MSSYYCVQKNKSYVWFVVMYFLFGVILWSVDPFVLPIYLTLFPIHSILLFLSIKTKNFLLVIYCGMLFLSHGIGSIFFYLGRERAESFGFGAVGNFNFSYETLYGAYSYLFIFLISLIVLVSIFKRRYHTNFLSTFLKEQYISIRLKSTWSLLPIALLSAIFISISFWMFSLHIGMIGLQSTELPYHLTGILFYTRRFVFPIVLLWCYAKTKNKEASTVILIIYSFVIGVSSASKSAALLVLLPIAYMNYIIGKKKTATTSIVASLVIYFLVGEMRTIIFDADANIEIYSVLSSSVEYSGKSNIFVAILSNITNRLYGLQATVLSDQYTRLTFNGLIDFYTGSRITEVVENYVKTLFGISLPDDKAYGVGLGYTGTMQLLSCHNYLYTILQAFIISIIFSIQNNSIQKIISTRKSGTYKGVALFILIFCFMKFYDGNEIITFYLGTIVLVAMKGYALKSKRHYVITYESSL